MYVCMYLQNMYSMYSMNMQTNNKSLNEEDQSILFKVLAMFQPVSSWIKEPFTVHVTAS